MFRQVARRPQAFPVDWGDRFEVLPWTEDKTGEIGEFLLRMGAESFADIPECADGSPASAMRYVTRAIEYERADPHRAAGFAASSLVYDKTTNKLIAVCLVCGTGVYHLEVDPAYRRRGIATNMLKRFLSVHAERGTPEVHLWRNDDSPGVRVYERLGFAPTGEVEDPPGAWRREA